MVQPQTPSAPRTLFGAILIAITSVGVAACRDEKSDATVTSASASASGIAERPPVAAAQRDEVVAIPGGAFLVGSEPGVAGRNPALEPRLSKTELGPFSIDKLPYPNDPTRPPMTNVPREQAARLCAEAGKRLCTELEWERACKGPKSELFATGQKWDPKCADEPRTCASASGVMGLGAAIREWTASDVVPTDAKLPRRAAIRGGGRSSDAALHRCAFRRGIDAATTASDLGFRCCKGPPNAGVVTEPALGQTFERTKIELADLEKLLAAAEPTAGIAKDLIFFREPDAANTVVSRGDGDKKGFLFTVAPLLWRPIAGSEFLIVAARSGKDTSFVAVFYVLGPKRYKLASSFIMQNETGPIALAYSGYIRPRLHFSSCWGCPGETGKILHRDPDSVLIGQP